VGVQCGGMCRWASIYCRPSHLHLQEYQGDDLIDGTICNMEGRILCLSIQGGNLPILKTKSLTISALGNKAFQNSKGLLNQICIDFLNGKDQKA